VRKVGVSLKEQKLVTMDEISDTIGQCSTHTSSFVSTANSHFTGPHENGSSAEREREAPPRGALYEVHRFISLEKAKLLALLIVLGCACNHALLRYKYGKCTPVYKMHLLSSQVVNDDHRK